MNEIIWDKVATIIENSNFFKKYGRKFGWTSGSSTYVYPITNWEPSRQIEIQLNGERRWGIISSMNALVKKLKEHIDIEDAYICYEDGSCPDHLRICYK